MRGGTQSRFLGCFVFFRGRFLEWWLTPGMAFMVNHLKRLPGQVVINNHLPFAFRLSPFSTQIHFVSLSLSKFAQSKRSNNFEELLLTLIDFVLQKTTANVTNINLPIHCHRIRDVEGAKRYELERAPRWFLCEVFDFLKRSAAKYGSEADPWKARRQQGGMVGRMVPERPNN